MTLSEITVAALNQLDRGHDSQNMATWSEKFTRFVNDAVLDLSEVLKLRRSETVMVEGGMINTALRNPGSPTGLERQCRKVVSVRRNGKELPFRLGPGSEKVTVLAEDGEAELEYRFVPKTVSSSSDVPEIPEYCHGYIVHYVVGRERATADPSMQRGGNIYFEMYNEAKRKLRRNLGEEDSYNIINRW